MVLWGLMAAGIVVLDQITKFLVVKNISPADTINAVKGVLEFVYVKNTGGAFSILNKATPLLLLISIIFCVGVVVYFIKEKPKDRLMCLSLTLMFAGAVGNGIDRAVRGYVVDFIKTVFVDFPVFNVADIAITIGAALILIKLIFYSDIEKEQEL